MNASTNKCGLGVTENDVSVHSPFFPPKRERKQKSAKEAKKQPKTYYLDAEGSLHSPPSRHSEVDCKKFIYIIMPNIRLYSE